jgi:beta-phosphoglucomutase family hydrolase
MSRFDVAARLNAVVLDLDGVITATRHLHIQAWTRAFNEYLAELQSGSSTIDERFRPFDPITDYANYVDGRTRNDGVRTFLAARHLTMQEGSERDSVDMRTIHGLSSKKDTYFCSLLDEKGPHVYKDALEALVVWRERGIALAVVSSSRNCSRVLERAGIAYYFRVVIDGNLGKRLGLRGKPDPSYFLEAARRLGLEPGLAMMVEDAVAGVEAGKRGGFGIVIGMDRDGQNAAALLAHGADRVVSQLTEVVDIPKKRAA